MTTEEDSPTGYTLVVTVSAQDVSDAYKNDYDGYSEHLQEKVMLDGFLLDLRALLSASAGLEESSLDFILIADGV